MADRFAFAVTQRKALVELQERLHTLRSLAEWQARKEYP